LQYNPNGVDSLVAKLHAFSGCLGVLCLALMKPKCDKKGDFDRLSLSA
jgi:hypothetical protein